MIVLVGIKIKKKKQIFFSLLAFPSVEIFQAFVNEQLDKNKKGLKRFELLMTPRVISSLIRSHDGLHHEDLRESHLTHLQMYVEIIDAGPEPTTSHNTATAQGNAVLVTIRSNCGGNASVRLASEQNLKTKTLTKYAQQKKFQKRFFTPKTLTKTLQTITRAANKTREFDLLDTRALEKEGLSLTFSCMLCPVLAVDQPKSAGKNKNKTRFSPNHPSAADKNDDNPYFQDQESYDTDSDGQSDNAPDDDDPGEGPSHRHPPPPSEPRLKKDKEVCFVDPTVASFNIFR